MLVLRVTVSRRRTVPAEFVAVVITCVVPRKVVCASTECGW